MSEYRKIALRFTILLALVVAAITIKPATGSATTCLGFCLLAKTSCFAKCNGNSTCISNCQARYTDCASCCINFRTC